MTIEIPFLLLILVLATPTITSYILHRHLRSLDREMAVNRRRIMALEAVLHD